MAAGTPEGHHVDSPAHTCIGVSNIVADAESRTVREGKLSMPSSIAHQYYI